MKLALGIFCIASVFLILFGGTVYEHGWIGALVSWGFALMLTGLICLGSYLIAIS